MRTSEDPGVFRTCEGFSDSETGDVIDVTPGMVVKTYPRSSPKEVQTVRQSGEYMVFDLISVYGKNSVASIKIGGIVELWSE